MKLKLTKEDLDIFYTNLILVIIGPSVAMGFYYILDLVFKNK